MVIKKRQLVLIVRRILVLGAIFVYIAVSLQAAIRSNDVLRGIQTPLTTYAEDRAMLIADYVGGATLRESKLAQVMGGTTTPRNDTLYLESLTETTFTGCSSAANFDPVLNGNAQLRRQFELLVTQGAYNLTFLLEYELIAPIIDCTFPPLVKGDKTHARVFYLVHRTSDPDNDVAILTWSMAVQNYAVPVQSQKGSALVATFTLINDMQVATSVPQHHVAIALGYPFEQEPEFDICTFLGKAANGEWILETIPRDPRLEQTKVLHTSMLRGFYIKAPTMQSNIKTMNWPLDTDPVSILSVWKWDGRTTLRDSWAWVHYIHAVFAVSTIFNQLILFLIMYRNYQLGKIWIGDAFAAISKTLVFRGTMVLISCHFNEYWALVELNYAGGYETAQISPPLYAYPEISRADIMTLYLCAVDFLGYMTKTRIDPAFTVLVFEIVFELRLSIAKSFPAFLKDYLIKRSTELHETGSPPVGAILAKLSPFRLWTANVLPKSQFLFLLSSAAVMFALVFAAAIAYVIARKLYTRRYPDRVYNLKTMSTGGRGSMRASSVDLTKKQTLTLFEIATGAELQNRFGVISDYDNFVFFKGMKFASADGIYCNGFVIANGKFLLATEDILTIMLMKVLRTRLRNVYTYEVDGSKLKQTAQLVYPHTIAWKDLLKLNVSILS